MSAEQEVRLQEIQARVDEFPADSGRENLFRAEDARFLLEEIASLKEQVESARRDVELKAHYANSFATQLVAAEARAESLSTELERVKKALTEIAEFNTVNFSDFPFKVIHTLQSKARAALQQHKEGK